jgi:hypothetical protein
MPVLLPIILSSYVKYFEGPWEAEPNDVMAQANGPLVSARDYFGRRDSVDDKWDRYSIYLPGAGHISARLAHAGPSTMQFFLSGCDGQALVSCTQTPCTLEYDGAAETSYVLSVYMPPEYATDTTYVLRATFPGARAGSK